MHRTILIFDLDGTICKSTLNTPQKIHKIMTMIKSVVDNNGAVYVVTARRLSDFDYKEYNLLEYHVPKAIVNLLLSVNKDKRDRWLYYNNDDDHPNVETFNILKSNSTKHKFTEYENFIKYSNKILHPVHLNLGMQKMKQIEDILKKYPLCINVYFFDDASHNKYAWLFYHSHINPHFSRIRFVGGSDKPVF